MPSSWRRPRSAPLHRFWPRPCGTWLIPQFGTGGRSAAALLTPIPPPSCPRAWWRLMRLSSPAGKMGNGASRLLISVELPIASRPSAYFFQEVARRHGDYALAGVAAHAIVNGQELSDLRMTFFAVADRPVLAKAASRLVSVAAAPGLIFDAAEAFGCELDPLDDQQASADLRRHLAKVLFRRCAVSLTGVGSAGMTS